MAAKRQQKPRRRRQRLPNGDVAIVVVTDSRKPKRKGNRARQKH